MTPTCVTFGTSPLRTSNHESALPVILGICAVERCTTTVGETWVGKNVSRFSRTALRILKPIHAFSARNEAELYRKMQEIEWWRLFDLRQTFAVDAVVRSSIFTHSHFVGLKTKDAIVDQFRDKMNRRPSVSVEKPDCRINVHIHEEMVSVSLDASGESLHRRGYRGSSVEAPLNEVLAAGIVNLSGFDGSTDFADMMCGSGTLLTEAALVASHKTPQYRRSYFCFKKWLDFDQQLFDEIEAAQRAQLIDFQCKIFGSDIDARAIKVAERNIDSAGFKTKIRLQRADFFNRQPPSETGILMLNPPYDERLALDDAVAFYQQIGDTLKRQWTGWTAWVLSGNLEAAKFIGLRPRRKIHLFNGAIECRLLKFELY